MLIKIENFDDEVAPTCDNMFVYDLYVMLHLKKYSWTCV